MGDHYSMETVQSNLLYFYRIHQYSSFSLNAHPLGAHRPQFFTSHHHPACKQHYYTNSIAAIKNRNTVIKRVAQYNMLQSIGNYLRISEKMHGSPKECAPPATATTLHS